MRDVGEGAAVDEGGAAFGGLHEVGQDRLGQQRRHRPDRLQIRGGHRVLLGVFADDEPGRAGYGNLCHAPRAPDGLQAKWRPYIEDAAFQTAILQDIFPDLEIVPYLLMPDTSRPCPFDGLHHQFTLRTASDRPHGVDLPAAEYTGDRRELHRGLFLTRVDVGQ